MPFIVAFFVRQLIVIGVQTGIFLALERFVVPILNKAITAIVSFFGVNEEEAKDILANEVLQAAEALGLTVALSRARIPLVVAEKLGFTSKGFGARTLSPTTQQKVTARTGVKPPPASFGGTLGKGLLTVTGGLLAWNVLTDWVWIGGNIGFLPEGQQDDIRRRGLAILDLINAPRSIVYQAEKIRRQLTQQERQLIKETADEADNQIAELQQAYEQKFVLFGRQDVARQLQTTARTLRLELESLRQIAGLIPRKPLVVEKLDATVMAVFDGDTVSLDNGETVRLVGIDAPESTTQAGELSKRYLKDRIEGRRVRVESDPNALMDIYGRRLGVIYLDEQNINIEMLQQGKAVFYFFEPNALVFEKQWKAAAAGGGVGTVGVGRAAGPTAVKGTISQGRFGPQVPFEEGPADEITSFEELRTRAKDVLTQFLQSIPGKIVYDIKLATSFIDESGIKRMAKAQTQQVGTNADGTPKMKTLLNRIAIADVYVITAGGYRKKIDRLVFGPTDAFKLTTGITQFSVLEQEIRGSIVELPVAVPQIEAPIPPVFVPPPPLAVVAPAPIPVAPAVTPAPPPATAPTAPVLPPDQVRVEGGNTMTGYNLPTLPQVAWPKLAPSTTMPRKVTVNVPVLFVRSAPFTTAPLAGSQRLVQGNVFMAVATHQGESVGGENRWWRSSIGNFVWVGGTAEKP